MSDSEDRTRKQVFNYLAQVWEESHENFERFIEELDPGCIFDIFKENDCEMYYGSDAGSLTQYWIDIFANEHADPDATCYIEDSTEELRYAIEDLVNTYFSNYRR